MFQVGTDVHLSNLPKIGFGTSRLKGDECVKAVSDALFCRLPIDRHGSSL